MPLFHPKVLVRHTRGIHIPPEHIDVLAKWTESLKKGLFDVETQSDARFIQRILMDVLGYVGRGDSPNWTLSKNQDIGGGNVDVALGNFTADIAQILAPLELKGAKTNLDISTSRGETPVQQAWRYANTIEGTKWVLVTNYREIRLYAYGKGNKNYETFDLTTLSEEPERYKRFILLLSAQNLLSGKTQSLLEESEQTGKDITDKFYKEYKEFRVRLIDNLTKDNPAIDKLHIIRHAQKVLDRILFVAFAESRELLPKNTLENTYTAANPYNPQPTWKNFVGLFSAINEGNSTLGIAAYNGGLFFDDAELNELYVSDFLCRGFKDIGSYDFNTEISVDILGHIFEQSISDLEELRATADGTADKLDKKKSKRKKDGVFYTPPYITQYIVEQTVGSWLAERRKEIGFDELPELPETKKASKKFIEKHIAAWESYKKAMSNIKVLDPACGSGAFLIEVFDYLCQEGKRINDELTRLLGYQDLFRWDTHILANNLFGVDLNRESVEITKLSLWLKTANKGEKLTYLEDNIKVGNSLIDDKTVAGDLAFDWKTGFSDIMAKGGFDVVVGNPPYFNVETLGVGNPQAQWIQKNYSDIWQDKSDILFYFIYKALQLSKGEVGYIISNAFLFSDKATKFRNHILKDGRLAKIVNFEQYQVFPDASITTGIVIFNQKHEGIKSIVFKEKNYAIEDVVTKINNEDNTFTVDLKENQVFALIPNTIAALNQKIDAKHTRLEELLHIGSGMQTAANDIFSFGNFPKQFPEEYIKKQIVGENISRYSLADQPAFLLYIENVNSFEDLPQSIQEHLENHRDKLSQRAQIIRSANSTWWKYTFAMHKEFYHLSKIWCSYRSKENAFILDETNAYIGLTNTTVIFDTNPDYLLKYILTLLNSKLLSFRYKSIGKQTGSGVFEYFANGVGKLPIPQIGLAEQQSFITLADKMLLLHAELQKERTRFQTLLSDNLGTVKMDDKRFDGLVEFKDFLSELKKQKKSIPLNQQAEWREVFQECKHKIASLRTAIKETDDEIDALVYKLYDLTPEEIAVVEEKGKK